MHILRMIAVPKNLFKFLLKKTLVRHSLKNNHLDVMIRLDVAMAYMNNFRYCFQTRISVISKSLGKGE